ncbi:TRAP transporter small permease subunit [Bordetella parapertussis]|uniref:TRAP transporter small permease protein n=2 Tax=Bordetella parapertussis TaxID=519 RepID=Q7W1R7_BORPA|nr:TRAP transporter small permease subunit [Bordetella parapertussis]AOB37655.1 C4-dicarboxylate ABC transporter substrate-binding protein [Bordetella parapertussis]AUL41614.1 C4-dicarboxylate ABC transporter substrate-binding protein [Bordetella parapertussis]AWP61523.1 C4-dicarboxylate ABC transporter substrate-binding protein [Bordetella parapertussis]AWP69021.1 C4-dicarboxylate ABC transporter substrate-binding protein [Bordetella parapertussis]AWP87615.1 C4-dicarboxylate ABC transporter s
MRALLALSRGIDALNLRVGRAVTWVTLLVVLVSAGNAVVRKVFHSSSNAWLELQWYMFGAMFLLTAGYTLLKNEHVRVDILSSRLPRHKQIWIEIFGVVFFLLSACILIMVLSWPVFMDSYLSGEQSSNSGGLIRWPVKLLIPVGFALLVLAGLSHLIKCIGFLRGQCPDPTARDGSKSAEELLAEEIAREALEREASVQEQRNNHEGR